jgi:hypothetical protein
MKTNIRIIRDLPIASALVPPILLRALTGHKALCAEPRRGKAQSAEPRRGKAQSAEPRRGKAQSAEPLWGKGKVKHLYFFSSEKQECLVSLKNPRLIA